MDKAAEDQLPNGLPRPYSDDPTQWIFHGHPCGSVVWDETQKQTVHGPLRTDATVLHLAVTRLLGYRWPAEHDVDMELADEQRVWVRRTDGLLEWMDEDGIVCIPSVRGRTAGPGSVAGLAGRGLRRRSGMTASSPELVANVGSRMASMTGSATAFSTSTASCSTIVPFVWHIWDGRRRDGFHALVNYHKLAAGDGKGRQLLESLTYSYLGDWIARQRDDAQRGEEGAEDRLGGGA